MLNPYRVIPEFFNVPFYSGVYQFGVTAFTIGKNSEGLSLGSANLSFTK